MTGKNIVWEFTTENGKDTYRIDGKEVSKDTYESSFEKEFAFADLPYEDWGTDLKASPVYIKDIPGYEGLYGVRSDGEIISYGGKSNHLNDIYLIPSIDKEGYRRVTLQKNKVREYYRVCRLVAQAFCPNPNELPVVNHIDKNKANDCHTNLEWTTLYENWKHSESEQLFKEIAVVQYTKDLDFVAEYQSLMEAARCTGINQGNISNCLSGKCKSVGGFVWKKK